MHLIGNLILTIWIAFWVYWFVSAFSSKKSVHLGESRFALVRVGIFLMAVILVRVSQISTAKLGNFQLQQANPFVAITGFILLLAGLAFAIWARLHLAKNWGMPMTRKKDPVLVTSGPYHYVRHPIYAGILIALLGTALATILYWLAILVVLTAYFTVCALEEEKLMTEQFPQAYPAYKKSTRMLIPFVL
jgi:protein-S-isoprenylcysteine O-methyltransferase Ste14